jgi:hypothetical protein
MRIAANDNGLGRQKIPEAVLLSAHRASRIAQRATRIAH